MIKNVCVFASSSNNLNQVYYEDASLLGQLLGKSGWNIVYGGSRLGLMYTCANAVKQNGGKIIGVMPRRLYDLGFGNPEDCDEFIITEGMRERKAKMDECSNAVIALAGGFGTLEEISEMVVQKQLGYNNKPIVILNTAGFYDKLVEFFNVIISQDFAKQNSGKLYCIANTPNDVVNYLLNYNPSEIKLASKF